MNIIYKQIINIIIFINYFYEIILCVKKKKNKNIILSYIYLILYI